MRPSLLAIIIGLGIVAAVVWPGPDRGPAATTTITFTPTDPTPNQTVQLTTTSGTTGTWRVNGKRLGNSTTVTHRFAAGNHSISIENRTRSLVVAPSSCRPYHLNGPSQEKADVVFVARNYMDRETWQDHLSYYLDLDQDNRGLFDIYPMNISTETFNLWTLNASTAIGTYDDPRNGRGLIKDARRDWFGTCSIADYHVLMSKDDFNHSAFAYGQANEMYIPGIADKIEREEGAVALPHEWGHGFGGLKDEYYNSDGRDASGPPNCADNRSQAERWWGELAQRDPAVGYYQGCAYTDTNWRPHEQSIMGNGGRWRYGPVNDRKLLAVLDQYD